MSRHRLRHQIHGKQEVDYSPRDSLSIPITTLNFRRFVAKSILASRPCGRSYILASGLEAHGWQVYLKYDPTYGWVTHHPTASHLRPRVLYDHGYDGGCHELWTWKIRKSKSLYEKIESAPSQVFSWWMLRPIFNLFSRSSTHQFPRMAADCALSESIQSAKQEKQR